jgi:hypothetical protein
VGDPLTRTNAQSGATRESPRGGPVTVYPTTRKEHPTRVCSRCFAKNIGGETFCKVCGDELADIVVDLDRCETRRFGVSSVEASLVIHPDGEGASDLSISLDKDIVLIGRASAADNVYPDVDLSQFDANNYVSRRHAFILRRQGALVLEDLESVNGTFVNTVTQIAPHVLVPLRDGDELTFGRTRCTIQFGLPTES